MERPPRTLTTLLLSSALLASVLAGQAAPTTADAKRALKTKIDKAIKDYEAIRKDKTKVAQRRRMIGWIGEINSPRVTKYLQVELARLTRWPSGTFVIEAMSKRARPAVRADLLRALKRADAHLTVRVAATEALFALGEEATAELLEIAHTSKDAKVRQGVLNGLSSCDSELVRRELARLVNNGTHENRRFVLVNTATIVGDPVIDQARVQAVKQGNLMGAATAWRLLAEQKNARAFTLTLDVIERVYDVPAPPAAAELVRGLAAVGDADFFPALLRFGAVKGRVVQQALKIAARSVAAQPELIDFLIEDGLESETSVERIAAKVLLAEAPASALQPLIVKVRKRLKRNRRKMLDTAEDLHELLSKDPTWVQDLASMVSAKDLESRMLGLALLLEMKSPAAVTAAQKCLRNRAWELRSLALRYLAVNRDVTSIPALIARYGAEDGRLKHELDAALFVHTGKRCWSRATWSRWWRNNKEGFALPHPDTVKAGGTTSGGQTVSYYDIPLVSSRLAFVVDYSGSMGAKVGTDRKRTRLDVAKKQLTSVFSALPKTHKVNVILFESNVDPIWKEVRPLTNSNRRELLEEVEAVKQTGGTNLFDAIEYAFQDPEVDTIYLLTDGDPASGRFTEPAEILEQIRMMNRSRQIVIHCISIGKRSPLLQDIAELTSGTYKEVR